MCKPKIIRPTVNLRKSPKYGPIFDPALNRYPAQRAWLAVRPVLPYWLEFMNSHEKPDLPFEAIALNQDAADDQGLWQAALAVFRDQFILRHDEQAQTRDWAMAIGACSHWLRPHQTRWTTAGGFASPDGYQAFLPEFDWSVIFIFRNRRWISVEKLPIKKPRLLRVAIPTRTARHQQAAVHTRWSPGNETALYGFRNLDGNWEWVAA
jgi:hypothetical protein